MLRVRMQTVELVGVCRAQVVAAMDMPSIPHGRGLPSEARRSRWALALGDLRVVSRPVLCPAIVLVPAARRRPSAAYCRGSFFPDSSSLHPAEL